MRQHIKIIGLVLMMMVVLVGSPRVARSAEIGGVTVRTLEISEGLWQVKFMVNGVEQLAGVSVDVMINQNIFDLITEAPLGFADGETELFLGMSNSYVAVNKVEDGRLTYVHMLLNEPGSHGVSYEEETLIATTYLQAKAGVTVEDFHLQVSNTFDDLSPGVACVKLSTMGAEAIPYAYGHQTINIMNHPPEEAVYGSTFLVEAKSSSGLPVEITTSGGCIIESGGMDSAEIRMTSGSISGQISFNQVGDEAYEAAEEKSFMIHARKRELLVIAENKTSQYSDPLEDLTHYIEGFLPGDDESQVSGQVVLYTDVTQYSDVATYVIEVDVLDLMAEDYFFTGIPGEYSITHEKLYIKYLGDIFKWVNQDLSLQVNGDDFTFLDMKAVVREDDDGYFGFDNNLKVSFVLVNLTDGRTYTSEAVMHSSQGSVQLTMGTEDDPISGISAGLYEITVEVIENPNYTSASDTKAVVVSDMANLSCRVEGSGSLLDHNDVNFGFYVGYSKHKNATPTGYFMMTYEDDEGDGLYQYVVKSNSWAKSSLYFISDQAAYFETKATITKYDMSTHESIFEIGNARFSVYIVDGDPEVESEDQIAIQVFDDKDVIFELGRIEKDFILYIPLNEDNGNILIVQ